MITPSDILLALADSNRRQILMMLRKRSMIVSKMAENFKISRPAV
jgi:DNA-binding transcriptional ArsR family regulator